MSAAEYEPLLIYGHPKYDVFKFDNLCPMLTTWLLQLLLLNPIPSLASLELKPLPDALKYSFLGPDESLPMIITFNLDRNKRKN